jgi:hypothetical protein
MSLPNPILRFTDGSKIVDILAPGSGWKMADPYWNPQIAAYKRGGFKINPSIAEGQRLVHKEYDNVIETIPIEASGPDQNLTIATINELLSLSRQAADFWAESYEFDDVWMEVAPACEGALVGYARISQMRIPELTNPYGQPFFSSFNEAVMAGLSLIVEREPLWRAVPPGQIIGPLYNLLKNPDFELWNFGITDAQPDSWSDLETIQITGTNNQQSIAPHSGNYALKVQVTGSTATGRFKGCTQIVANTRDSTEYTAIAWVRSDGVSNGVGRILITYSSQLELYRSSTMHGWTLYTGKFTTGIGDIVAINCEILTTAAFTVGTVYFDSLMILEGDWKQYAIDKVLPYLSSSNIVNHWDQPGSVIEAGDINYVDVWDVPGNVDALLRLTLINNTPSAEINSPIVYSTIIGGMRRAQNVLNFQNFFDPTGPVDTTSSGDDRIATGALSVNWRTIATYIINDDQATADILGRFRVFARVYDTLSSGVSNLEVRLRYWIGQANVNVKVINSITPDQISSWVMLNLTENAGLNWDVKGVVLPGSVGFDIQMRRGSGVQEAYFDYALILPTDGGIILADVSPPIPFNSGLVIDNTGSTFVYGARLARGGWRVVYATDNPIANRQETMVDFNEALFIGTNSGEVFKFQNNTGALGFNYGANRIPVVVYNQKLYILSNTYAPDGQAYSSDGTTFPGTVDFTYGSGLATDGIGFQGYLYISASAAGAEARLYRWDGTAGTATLIYSNATLTGFQTLRLYQNKIYLEALVVGTNVRQVWEYNTATGIFALSHNTGATGLEIGDFTEFLGKLYWVTGTSLVFSFNGATWSNVTPSSIAAVAWFGLEVANSRIYVCGYVPGVPDRAIVISSADGVVWQVDYEPGTTGVIERGIHLRISQGQLFMSTRAAVGVAARLHVIALIDNQYKVSDYQLSEFYSPPKKRHRFFFNYSRENGVNNVDDAALLGIGFVPRYLALRGNG